MDVPSMEPDRSTRKITSAGATSAGREDERNRDRLTAVVVPLDPGLRRGEAGASTVKHEIPVERGLALRSVTVARCRSSQSHRMRRRDRSDGTGQGQPRDRLRP